MRTHSYTIEESDLDEHWRDWNGQFVHPDKIGVPLCSQCDTIIRDGLCPACSDEQLTEVHGDPLRSLAA